MAVVEGVLQSDHSETSPIEATADHELRVSSAGHGVNDLSGTVGTANSATGTTTAAGTGADAGSNINTVTMANVPPGTQSKVISIYNLDGSATIYLKAGGNWVALAPMGAGGDVLEDILVSVATIQIKSASASGYGLLVTQ